MFSIININKNKLSDDDILDIRQNMESIGNRSLEWLKAAAHKICPLLKLTLAFAVNSNKSFRMEMYNMCELLITNCSSNLDSCMECLLECLIILSEDDVEELSKRARQFLNSITSAEDFNSNHRKFFENLLEKKLSNIFRISRRGFSTEQEFELTLLKGFFNIFLYRSMSIRNFLLLPDILDKFIYGIIHNLELQVNKDLLTNFKDEAISLDNLKKDNDVSWQKFRNIGNEKHCKILCDILKICGGSDAAELIFERLIEIQRTSDFTTEIHMIVTILVCGSESLPLQELCLQNLLVPDNFDLTIELEEKLITEVSRHLFTSTGFLFEQEYFRENSSLR